MKFLLKRSSILILFALVTVSVGCRKNVSSPVVPLPAPPPPPPPPPNPGPPPTITLRADNTAITAGQSATLTYAATNATTVTIQPEVGAVQPATGGTRQVTPTAATTYTATANGPGGTAQSAGVTITVNPRAAAPPPAPPPAAPPNRPDIGTIFTQQMVPILFDYDKSNIRAIEESKLLDGAAWLKQNAAVRFQIEGHADERGGQEYNIALADERAAAVKKYLAGQGIAENRMTTVSFGEERPICREQNENCFQQNRRAAFTRIP